MSTLTSVDTGRTYAHVYVISPVDGDPYDQEADDHTTTSTIFGTIPREGVTRGDFVRELLATLAFVATVLAALYMTGVIQ